MTEAPPTQTYTLSLPDALPISDCDASENFVFVRGKVLTAVATGVAMAPLGRPYVLSCADIPGTVDYILTPADIEYLNDLGDQDRKSTRLNSSHGYSSYAVVCQK